MSIAPGELTLPDSSSSVSVVSSLPSSSHESCYGPLFSNLRGVRWRINLGILPSSSSIDDLRRVAADSRRKYARLRRHLLIDPHLTKDEGNEASNLFVDNPLSQNPDSTWGRFFRNAELEKMVDQDLLLLYPEHDSYFQTPPCQAMMRRILLLWCFGHSDYGYGQGMHELLAPLLYALHVDVKHLSEVRDLYEDQFSDMFDGVPDQESNTGHTYNFTVISSPISNKWAMGNDGKRSPQGTTAKVGSLDELDPDVRTIILLSDAYGAEGELGILLSERFMEHDAYCMFDALMSGSSGTVAMADFFSPSPTFRSLSGVPPIIEASSALYHLLSIVDTSLHVHLVELGVEPQYFALRWLRVLFGREFSLEDLLVIWDEIFASSNEKSLLGAEDDLNSNKFMVLSSPRGALIAAIAVSMLLYIRSSLLATENATLCLQRLLHFPESIDVKKLIQKAKSLQTLALDPSAYPSPSSGVLDRSKSASARCYSLSTGSASPTMPLGVVPESYWEEKWRVLHKEEEFKPGMPSNQLSAGAKGSTEKKISDLARTGSAPPSVKVADRKKDAPISIRQRLLETLSQEFGNDTKFEKSDQSEFTDTIDSHSVNKQAGFHGDPSEQDGVEKSVTCVVEENCLGGPALTTEESSNVFSASMSPCSVVNDHENGSEKSTFTSLSSCNDNDGETSNMGEPLTTAILDDPLPPNTQPMEVTSEKLESKAVAMKQPTVLKERKLWAGKFQWFWKFGRFHDGAMEKGGNMEAHRTVSVGSQNAIKCLSTAEVCSHSSGNTSTSDVVDKNTVTFRNIGQSMLENIQAIEMVFQQDGGQVASLDDLSVRVIDGKGQVTVMAALKELRKINNLLSEIRRFDKCYKMGEGEEAASLEADASDEEN